MLPHYSRRSTLALLGGVALAGCSAFRDDRYWDDPPSFDATGLETVTDRSIPERPHPIPVTLGEEHHTAMSTRVSDLLAPIPEPLSATTVPNGEIREALDNHREDARVAVDRMGATSETLTVVEASAEAGQHAADAAGIWAAITTAGSPESVTVSLADLQHDLQDVIASLPDEAADAEEGAVVHGSIEAWLDEARRSTLVGRLTRIREQPNPLRVGRLLGDFEHIRVEIQAGAHIRDQYVEGLETPRQVEDDLSHAVDELAPVVEARIQDLHDGEEERPLFRTPDVADLIDRQYHRDEPGVRLYSRTLSDLIEELRFVAIAWPEIDDDTPSLRLRNTTWVLAVLDALEELRTRIEEGEDLFPPDATTIREARSEAIDAVHELGASPSPLQKWIAWRLVPAFGQPDELVDSVPDNENDGPTLARVYGEYVWLRLLAQTATETVPRMIETYVE